MRMKKRITILAAVTAICLLGSGCSAIGGKKQISDVDVVTTVLNAYQQGDYESMKPYLDEDSKFHPMLAAVTAENATAMDKVYQEAYALTKNFTYTAEAVEGEEKWGHVKVHIQTNNIVSGISDSMAEAIAEQVKNGGDSFYDVPTWLMAGLKSGEAVDEEFVVTVTLINKKKMISTQTGELFSVVSGGFSEYMNLSMTRCTDEGEQYDIVSSGDEIKAMLEESVVDAEPEELTEEYLTAFADTFGTLPGVFVKAEVKDEEHLLIRLGFNMDTASSKDLADMGIISDRLTTGGGHLSLDSTIRGFEETGMTCVTEDYSQTKSDSE